MPMGLAFDGSPQAMADAMATVVPRVDFIEYANGQYTKADDVFDP